MRKRRTKGRIEGILLLIAAAFIFYILFDFARTSESNRTEFIESDHSLTISSVNFVSTGGEAFDMSLEYVYEVEGKEYSRIVEIPPGMRSTYGEFIGDRGKAKRLRLITIYSNLDHSKSLVDLSINVNQWDSINLDSLNKEIENTMKFY